MLLLLYGSLAGGEPLRRLLRGQHHDVVAVAEPRLQLQPDADVHLQHVDPPAVLADAEPAERRAAHGGRGRQCHERHRRLVQDELRGPLDRDPEGARHWRRRLRYLLWPGMHIFVFYFKKREMGRIKTLFK
jgi:hypothetical protein